MKFGEFRDRRFTVDVYGDGSLMARYKPSAFNDRMDRDMKVCRRLSQEVIRLQKLQAEISPEDGARLDEIDGTITAKEGELETANVRVLMTMVYDTDLKDDETGDPIGPLSELQWRQLGYVIQGHVIAAIQADLEKKGPTVKKSA